MRLNLRITLSKCKLIVGLIPLALTACVTAQEDRQNPLASQESAKPQMTATPTPSPDIPPSPEAPEIVLIKGTVSGVSRATFKVIDAQRAEHSIAMRIETKVLSAGEVLTLADVQAGDVVTVKAKKEADGALTAVSISLEDL